MGLRSWTFCWQHLQTEMPPWTQSVWKKWVQFSASNWVDSSPMYSKRSHHLLYIYLTSPYLDMRHTWLSFLSRLVGAEMCSVRYWKQDCYEFQWWWDPHRFWLRSSKCNASKMVLSSWYLIFSLVAGSNSELIKVGSFSLVFFKDETFCKSDLCPQFSHRISVVLKHLQCRFVPKERIVRSRNDSLYLGIAASLSIRCRWISAKQRIVCAWVALSFDSWAIAIASSHRAIAESSFLL